MGLAQHPWKPKTLEAEGELTAAAAARAKALGQQDARCPEGKHGEARDRAERREGALLNTGLWRRNVHSCAEVCRLCERLGPDC